MTTTVHHPPRVAAHHVVQSANGWQVLRPQSGNLGLLHLWRIPCRAGETRVNLRNGSAGFVLAYAGMRFDETAQPLVGGQLDDWGYAYRPIRGRVSGFSNHASGTAFDMNATKHPLGRRGTFAAPQVRAIRALLHELDGTVGWGGDYRHRKDEMHFEVQGTLEHCEQVARRLMERGDADVERLLKANPGQREVILS